MRIRDRKEFTSKVKPLSLPPETLVSEAVARMSEMNFGSVIVTDPQNKILGMVTERDLMKRVLNQNRDPQTTKLSDIMTRDVRVAHPDDNVIDWLRIMSNERFRRLPVVDQDGHVQAIMTQGDFVSYTWPDLIDHARDVTRATISSNYQLLLIAGGILIYSIILIAFLVG
jgi:CBS domain-containing protein